MDIAFNAAQARFPKQRALPLATHVPQTPTPQQGVLKRRRASAMPARRDLMAEDARFVELASSKQGRAATHAALAVRALGTVGHIVS